MENLTIGEGLLELTSLVRLIKHSQSFPQLLKEWKNFGRNLGVDETKILSLERRLGVGTTELPDIPHEFLSFWKADKGNSATLKSLFNALVTTQLQDIADLLEQEFWSVIVRSLKIRLHEKEVKLEELLPANTSAETYRLIYDAFKNHKCIQPIHLFRQDVTPKPATSYYIPRTLSYMTQVDEKIFKADISNHLFLVKGVSKHELARLSEYKPVDVSGNQVDEITVRFMVLEHDDDYDIICRKTNDPVHIIHYQNCSYFWIKSSKGLDTIQQFIKENRETYNEQEFIHQFTSSDSTRTVSISDSPGMGKTFLLENLALRLKTADKSIVLFIVLQEFAKQVQIEINSQYSALTALSEYVQGSEGARLILDAILTNLRFDLFLDGYDEVDQSKLIMVDAFMKHAKELKYFRVFVTTRPHLRTQLENTLNLISYEILPFNESNQIEFLTKYWVDKHQAPKLERVNTYAQKCLKALREQMTDMEMRIAGIPLQCRMLADVFAEDAIKVSNLQYAPSAERIKITSLFEVYTKLIDLKFQRVKEISAKSNYINVHIRHSIMLLFPSWIDKFTPLLVGSQEVDENVLYSIGLIEKSLHSNTPRFIHRTFAEYMLAEFLVKQLENHRACVEFLFGVILGGDGVQQIKSVLEGPDSFELEYPTIGYFLNMHLRNQVKHYSILDMPEYHDSIKLEDVCKAVAACASHDFEACFDLSVEIFCLINNNNAEYSVNLFDMYFNTYFKYLPHLTIRSSKRVKLIRKVLNFIKQNFRVNLSYHVYYNSGKTSYFPWISKSTPLHVPVYYGRYNIVTYLVEQYGERIKEIKYLLHLCARYSSKEVESVIEDKLSIIELLVAETKKRDISLLTEWMDDRTPLLEQDVHINLLRRFVELGADINISSKYGTLLHTSGNSKNYHDLLHWVMSNGFKSVSSLDQNARTPLLDAIERNEVMVDVHMLELFHKNGADFNASDKNGDSVLFHALRVGRSEAVISKLIDYGANVNHQNAKKQNAAHVLLGEYPFKDSQEVLHFLNLLISKGFNLLNSPDSEDFVPFSLVLENVEQLDNPDLFEFFHAHGVDFNASFKCKKMTSGSNQGKESFGKYTIRSKNRWNTNQRRDDFSKSESRNNFKDLVCWASSNGLNTVDLSEQEIRDLFDQAETDFVFQNFNEIRDPFISSSVDANETESVDNPTLFKIIGRISLASVEKIIECGANVNQENKNNINLAHAVIVNTADRSKVGSKGAIDVLNFLMSKGFTKIDHPDKEGMTPLYYSLHFKEHTNMDMLGFFRENEANFNVADDKGRSVIVVLVAIHSYGERALISKCLKYGADLYQVDSLNRNVLHYAAASRIYANVEFVIDKFDINSVDDFGGTPLHALFDYIKEDPNILKLLDLFHEKGANFNAVRNPNGMNVLFDAIRSNQSLATLKKLIEYGAHLYHRNAWKANALHCASCYRNKAALKFLMDKFDINSVDEYGKTPLHDLVSDDFEDYSSLDPKLLDLFYKNGANFNAFDNRGYSVLFHAIWSNHNKTVIAKLLQCGANLYQEHSEKETMFHTAACFRNSSALEFLIDKFDIDSEDKYGRTPLHFLFLSEEKSVLDLELLDLFHRNGANFNAKDNEGHSILYHAMSKNIRNPITAVVSKLLQCGADLHNLTSEKSNALHIAAQNRDYEVLEFLVDKVDLNSVDKGKRTPLHSLVSKTEALDVKLLDLFHKKGANFNASDNQRRSILFEAIMTNQNASVISKIIEYGGDPYYQNRYGDSALLIAAWHANSSALEYLLETFSFDIDAVNKFGNTPLHLVFFEEDKDYRGVLELLLKRGSKFDIKNKKGYIPLVQWITKGKNPIPTLLEIKNLLFSPSLRKLHAIL